jgi:septal ring factor EnvC (AmiA/AmiB activator)
MDTNEIMAESHHPPGATLASYVPTMIVLVSFLGTAAYFVATTRSGEESLTRDTARLESEISKTQILITQGLQGIRSEIATLPDQRARMDAVERRLLEMDRRDSENAQAIGVLDHSVNQLNADVGVLTRDVDGITRASRASLPGRR